MISQIETILGDITILQKKERNRNTSHADRFNLFGILQITSDEVRLHSRFLAELLNPNGTHDQGTIFLDKFLDYTGCHQVFTDTNRVRVLVEHHIGSKTMNSGGRIDLMLIDDKRCAVIIENKIFAGDQQNQLLRYYNYGQRLKADKGNYSLLYLTLHGNEASDWSTGQILTETDYRPVSYAFHIRAWLEACIELSAALPKLQIALLHYLQLIDQLTGIHMNQELQGQIAQRLIHDASSFEAALAVSASLTKAKQILLHNFGMRIKEALQLKPEVRVEISPSFGMQYQGMEIFYGDSGEPQNRRPHIRLSFLRDVDNCYLEIHPGLVDNTPIPKVDWKQQQYAILLKEHFSTPDTKILNTENYWQGEWVCHYYKLDNAFDSLIEKSEVLFHEVIEDLNYIYDQFLYIETDAK